MSSRREEERNEKIIRGLMKLPPNRRCINCNSLVPQYVCTNFWTFVCTTCSGIHREFTHRVKSVSMAKFTTQELEALQNGGNQRAREIYLKEWDPQNSKLPDNSKADKIREFIKNVYVNKKYVGGKSSDNASRDAPHLSGHEDDVRRASSYHSYSQSPPYDFQYEERRYGKRTSAALSRKPGSDRGLYEKNFASFLSPSRLTDRSPNHASEDNGSISSETSREFSSEDLNHLRNSNVDLFSTTDGGKMSHSQRTVSFPGNYGVPNNQLPSSKSIDSTGSVHISSESVQTLQPSLSQSSPPPMNFNGLDLFDEPQNVTPTSPAVHFPEFSSKPPIDLFESFPTTSFTSNHMAQPELPSSKPPIDLFQSFPTTTSISNHVAQPEPPSSKPPIDLFESFPTTTFTSNHVANPEPPSSKPPIDLFQSFPTTTFTSNHVVQPEPSSSKPPIDLFESFPTTTFTANHVAQPEPPSPALLFSDNPKRTPTVSPNEGWATFDFPQHSTGVEKSTTMNFSSDMHSFGNFEPNQLPTYPDFPSSATLPIWNNDHQNIEAVPSIENSQVWNAFDDTNGHLQTESGYRSSNEATKFEEHTSIPSVPSDINIPHDFPSIPVGPHSFTFNHVSSNPFDDITYDPAPVYNDVPNLWDMSSMQEALPNGQITTNQDWFSDDPIGPFCPPGSEGTLEFGANQGSSKQLMNGTTQSVGGNPFA